LFGPSSQYIKTNSGDFIATEGSNIRERLMLSDLRIPYKQILKSRIILKKGQTNYLLNHLGFGDNATFLAIKAVYDSKSIVETDNYIQYSYYDDLGRVYTFSQLLTLTGNSSNRVKQLYLTNPNPNYPVYLDVMVAVIDDNYEFFNDNVNQSATTFTGLEVGDIKTHVIGESIVIYDKSTPTKRPLIYFNLSDINSIERDGKILTIDDSSLNTVLLQFISVDEAAKAQSLLNYVIDNPYVDIDAIDPNDSEDPILYFFSNVGGALGTGSYIQFNGTNSGVPYDTSYGYTFSTSIQMNTYGTSSINKSKLGTLLIDKILDNRDGTMSYVDSNLLITSASGSSVTTITSTGSYVLTFDFSDIALNYLDGVFVNIDII
jgi:hypothetical protein